MNDITVTVTTKNLWCNSYEHGKYDPDRKCPLWEALDDAGYAPLKIGGYFVMLRDGRTFRIDTTAWAPSKVEMLIEDANRGKEIKYDVLLTGRIPGAFTN